MIKIEITDIDDLIAFVAIIRCQDLTIDELKAIVDKLSQSRTTLEQAMAEPQIHTRRP